jgi:hypothetical protein
MTRDELVQKLESMKGLAGSGTVLGETIKKVSDFFGTMEPGDIARTSDGLASAVPIAYDLWYLTYHQNLMQKYYEVALEAAQPDFKHYKYDTYLSQNLSFLSYLPGLKPLKVLTDLRQQLNIDPGALSVFGFEVIIPSQYKHNGIYWINTAFFELRQKDSTLQYPSDGSQGFKTKPNDYVGYLAFPIGQLGVMEVISLFQETDLSGYAFAAYSSSNLYHQKAPLTNLEDKYKPAVQNPPQMFPDAKDEKGNAIAGQHHCFGRHLIEGLGYYKPDTLRAQQNQINSDGSTAYAPQADLDVEVFAEKHDAKGKVISGGIKDYGEDIKPKLWMRYWIHKDSTLPVPGEFIGILVRPVATPPHVWWFQESSPFLYAGNWMETYNLTSGVVKTVTLEAARTDGGTGNLYTVSIQGCQVNVESSDFLEYSVGDRVAVLKTDSLTPTTKAFSSLDQLYFKDTDKDTGDNADRITTNYIIIPATFYKIKH